MIRYGVRGPRGDRPENDEYTTVWCQSRKRHRQNWPEKTFRLAVEVVE